MVNYNSWSESSDKDSDDDAAEGQPYTGAAYQPVEQPRPRQEEGQGGVIFSRRVPLHELIDAEPPQAQAKAAEAGIESDDDDDDDESSETPQQHAYKPVADGQAEAAGSDDEADIPAPLPDAEPYTETEAQAYAPADTAEDAQDRAPAAEPSAFEPVMMPEPESGEAPRTPAQGVPVEQVMNPAARDYNTHPITYQEAMTVLDGNEDDDGFTAARQPLRPFRMQTPAPPPPAIPRPPAESGAYSAAPSPSEHLIFGSVTEAAPRTAEPEPTPFERRTRGLVGVALAAVGVEYALRKANIRRSEGRTAKRLEEQRLAAERGQEFLRRQQQQFAEAQARQTDTLQQVQATQERMEAMPLTYGSEQTAAVSPQRVVSEAIPAMPHEQTAEQRPFPPVIMNPEAARPQPVEAPVVMSQEALEQVQQQEQQPKLHEAGDAWRHYMVDEHNREVVGARAMGRAYENERAQEIRHDPTADDDASVSGGLSHAGSSPAPAVPVHAGSGVPTFVPSGSYASGNHGGGTSVPGLPSGMTTPALPPGVPTHVDPQHQLEEPRQGGFRQGLKNPWFWLMVGLVVAAFFVPSLL